MATRFDRFDLYTDPSDPLGYGESDAGRGRFWLDTALDELTQGYSPNTAFNSARLASAARNDQSWEGSEFYNPNDEAYDRKPKQPVARGPQPMPSQASNATNLEQARRNAYAQGPDVGLDFDRTHGNAGDEGSRLAALIASGDSSLSPDIPLDAAGARQFQLAQQAQKAFMAQQGIQGKQDAQAMKATQQLLANPGMQFGKGGGDWASAWSKAMQPQRGIFESLVGNQLGSFLDYGKGLNQTFNSATGPYGQMQAAAVATAPSRAQRAISKDKLGMLSGLFDQMSANKTPSVSSVETDYGAYAKMLPSLMKKYLPGG